MPIKVYVGGAKTRDAATAIEWLRRSGFDPVTAEPAEADWAKLVRPTMADCDIVLMFARPRARGTLGRAADGELGIAVGLNKRVVVVGRPEYVLHESPQCEHYERWEDARVSLGGPAVVDRPPEMTAGLDLDEYALRFWAAHAQKVILMPQYLDAYVAGIADRAGEHARVRAHTYMNTMAAWRALGRPKGFVFGDEKGISPESEAFADHTAMMEWFAGCVRLAEIDRERAALAAEKETLVKASCSKRRRPSAGSGC